MKNLRRVVYLLDGIAITLAVLMLLAAFAFWIATIGRMP